MSVVQRLRNFISFLFCFNFLIGFSQINSETNFKLLPTPAEFKVLGKSDLKFSDVNTYFASSLDDHSVHTGVIKDLKLVTVDDAVVILKIDAKISNKAEAYELKIDNDKIYIVGKDEAGLFYGLKTLEQLLEDARDQNLNLPICKIIDAPKLTYRAIQLDIKHHIETLDYYYDLMDYLAGLKVNAIIVEMEDKIAYEKHQIIGSNDAFSIREWADLSNYAKERNIEISPLIQGLGHASFVLKHEKYEALRDDPKSDWAFNPLDPKTYDLQFDLYREAIKATPHGKYLHIGGDEVHTTGRESGRSALDLQLEWLNKVCKFAEEHGRIPIFWDDMPLKQAGVYKPMFSKEMTQEEVDAVWNKNEHKLLAFLDQFPKNCIYMRWNYHTPEALGNTKAMEWFRENDLQVMGATAGQTRWVLMPQRESNIREIRTFALSSISSGLNGLLLTLWDDDSPHFELYKRGINAFAEFTWSGDKKTKSELKMAYRHRQFAPQLSNDSYAFIDDLEVPVANWKNILLNGNKRNYLKKHKDGKEKLVINLPSEKIGEWTREHKKRIELAKESVTEGLVIAEKISKSKQLSLRNNYTLEVYEQVNNLVVFSSDIILKLETYDTELDKNKRSKLKGEFGKLIDEFNTLRNDFESVYGKTRVLEKPESYILDQDHHVHLANQSINFDWQFYAEILFLEKLEDWIK